MFNAMENLLLAALSEESRELIVSQATPVTLPLRSVLYRAGNVLTDAYFMTSGLASIVGSTSDGDTAEVGIVGHEGVVGSMHLLGPAAMPTDCFIQLSASALKISYPKLAQLFRTSEEIRGRILEFVQEQILTLSQLATCNRLHNAEERLSRWLLMVDDRIQSDTIHLTQEFLAQMLGAQRTTVTMVAGALQRSGLIEYKRGQVKIVNRAQLESAACDCYGVTQKLYFNLYKQKVPAESQDGFRTAQVLQRP
ncbi:MAG TPA: Crp/Fnr family transcriptional regulator [Acidobacteriaceae bacterium]|nr:Crp/Fnr family transcriptional regulator [Acidobacteriaceae bacterium]